MIKGERERERERERDRAERECGERKKKDNQIGESQTSLFR